MNLFSRALSWFGVGALSAPDKGAQVAGASVSTEAGISVTDDKAMQVSAVWACTQLITNSICSLPLDFYRKKPDGGRTLLTDHYLNDLFHVSPNAHMKPRDFRKAMTMQLVTWSNAYAFIDWNSDRTRPLSITPLRPGRMTPVIQDNGELVYHYSTDMGIVVYSKASIMHLKGFGADGVSGLERNSYSRQTLGVSVSADVYAAKQFANGGRSGGGYLSFDEFLTPDQRIQARELYSGMSETAYNKGKLWLLEGGVKYDSDTVNPDTMQMMETRGYQIGEVARYYGVPEVMIGGGGATSAWPASFEQQILSFLTFTLQDYIDEWEHAIKDSLITDKRRIFADHDVSGFIKMDSTAKADYLSKLTQNGLLTRNEGRKTINYPSMDGGDDLTVQVNLVPAENLGQTTEVTVGTPISDE